MELSDKRSDIHPNQEETTMEGANMADFTLEEISHRQEEMMAEARQTEVFNHNLRTLDMARMSVNNSSRN